MDWSRRHNINEWISPEPKSYGARLKLELDLSNYTTKTDLKNSTSVDTSKFYEKIDLAKNLIFLKNVLLSNIVIQSYKCISWNNQKCVIQTTLINVHLIDTVQTFTTIHLQLN